MTNAVITWTTEYYGLAVESMRRSGRCIDDEVLAHISPAHSENINFFGAIEVDIEVSSPSSARPGTGRCASATPSSDTRSGWVRYRSVVASACGFYRGRS